MTETAKRRGRKPKSSFYHARWHKVGLNVDRAAEILGVTCNDILSFDEHGNPLAERYLLLWDTKHINYEGWNGWIFSQGCLVHKRQRWRPDTLLEAKENITRIEQLELELRKLESWPGLIQLVKRLVKRKRRYRRMNFNVI